jgi:hypothetical protein
MDFGDAIKAMKNGERVTRPGWNGKNMHIYMEEHINIVLRRAKGIFPERQYEPCIIMFTAQGTHQPGWTPSQKDIFSEDWEVVE